MTLPLITIKDIAIARRSRKGEAHQITADGAYWLAIDVNFRSYGGDGIGQSASDKTDRYRVRHYRSGEVRAYCETYMWHQNDGDSVTRTRCDATLNAATVEDLIAMIQKVAICRDYEGAITTYTVGEWGKDNLTNDLQDEMPIALPAPDDDVVPTASR